MIPLVAALPLLYALLFSPFAAGQVFSSAGMENIKDGWEVASPSEEKLDAVMINSMLERVRSGIYRNVHSVIIAPQRQAGR